MDYPMKKARNHLGDHPPFNALRRRIMEGRRKAEEARNLATAIKIRDDEGDESALAFIHCKPGRLRPVREQAAAKALGVLDHPVARSILPDEQAPSFDHGEKFV